MTQSEFYDLLKIIGFVIILFVSWPVALGIFLISSLTSEL